LWWHINDHTNSINGNHNRKLVTNVSYDGWWKCEHVAWCRNPNLGFMTKARGCKGAGQEWCCNPSSRLVTKVRTYKGVGQEWSSGITFHVFGSAKECEGMNPHTPKWTPILGVGVPMDSQIFKGWLQGSKLIGSKSSLYYWNFLELRCLKWARMTHLDI